MPTIQFPKFISKSMTCNFYIIIIMYDVMFRNAGGNDIITVPAQRLLHRRPE